MDLGLIHPLYTIVSIIVFTIVSLFLLHWKTTTFRYWHTSYNVSANVILRRPCLQSFLLVFLISQGFYFLQINGEWVIPSQCTTITQISFIILHSNMTWSWLSTESLQRSHWTFCNMPIFSKFILGSYSSMTSKPNNK